jgi:hypothetical protein
MTDEQIALARRVVACKGWRWLPGTRTTDAMRVIHDETAFPGRPCAIREGSWVDTSPPRPLGDALPDLTDPATLGCLLALVREAWDDPGFYTTCGDVRIKDTDLLGWDFFGNLRGKSCKGMLYRSEAEALVAALEAAP